MNENVVKATELAGSHLANDMSILSLIGHADLTVKLVMLILVLASVWSWAIIFDRYTKYRLLSLQSDKFEKLFWSGQLLDQLYERIKGRTDHPLANIFIAAMQEWNRNSNYKDNFALKNLKSRINQAMNLVINRESDKLEGNLSFLVMVASNAFFIGLFGTIWGIVHSFQAIAASKNTSLAVVAPGIAEALLATAVALVAAIPASIFYNVLVVKLGKLQNRMEDFSAELSALLFREIDEGK